MSISGYPDFNRPYYCYYYYLYIDKDRTEEI